MLYLCFVCGEQGISAAQEAGEHQLRVTENSDRRGALQNRVFKLLFLRISYHVFSPHSPPRLLDAPLLLHHRLTSQRYFYKHSHKGRWGRVGAGRLCSVLNNTANGSFTEMEIRQVPVRKSQQGFAKHCRQNTAGPYRGTCCTMQGHHGDRPLLAWSRPSQEICVPRSFSLLAEWGMAWASMLTGRSWLSQTSHQ